MAVGSMIILQNIYIFCKRIMLSMARVFELYVFFHIFPYIACSLTRCPGFVELIHSAWYHHIAETCIKIHCKVAPSFPGGVSQVWNILDYLCSSFITTWFSLYFLFFNIDQKSLAKQRTIFWWILKKHSHNIIDRIYLFVLFKSNSDSLSEELY